MEELSQPHRRMIVVADMEKYSKRSSQLQHEAQDAFHRLVGAAAETSGVPRTAWLRQGSGDGELAILPPEQPEAWMLGRFLRTLDARLQKYNATRIPAGKIRLRMAFHQGPVHLDSANGFAGTAVNEAARLCDAPVFKQAFAAFPYAAVACIVSDGIHHDIVCEEADGIRRDRFRRIEVSLPEKGFREPAWISIVGDDVHQVELPDPPPSAEKPNGGVRPRPTGGNTMGDVHVSGGQVSNGDGTTMIGSFGRPS